MNELGNDNNSQFGKFHGIRAINWSGFETTESIFFVWRHLADVARTWNSNYPTITDTWCSWCQVLCEFVIISTFETADFKRLQRLPGDIKLFMLHIKQEAQRDCAARCRLKSCQLLHNCTKMWWFGLVVDHVRKWYHIITFRATSCDLEKSLSFDKTVDNISHM